MPLPREKDRLEKSRSRVPVRKPGVLVVDDDRLMRIMVKLGLERHGFDVFVVPNGRHAIDLYQDCRGRIDVVLLDIRMPGLDGPATLDALRAKNPQVRACFMSGDEGASDPETLLRCGAARVFAKPFDLDQLADFLRLLSLGVDADQFLAGRKERGGIEGHAQKRIDPEGARTC